jgi:hypothetical protein
MCAINGVAYLGWTGASGGEVAPNIGSVFAAMTTRNVPLGTGRAWLPPLPYIPKLVLLANASKSALSAGSPSISAIFDPITVIPAGCPPATMALGMSRQGTVGGGSGIGIGRPICHPASWRATSKWNANCQLSEASGRYQISTGALGLPAISLANISWFRPRGPASTRNCSSFSSASLVCAVAFAISAWATPSAALACSVCVSNAVVRSSENLSFMAPILIEPYVPTATANAPKNNIALKASYQKLAQGKETSNISTLAVLGFLAVAGVWFIVVWAALRKAIDSWRKARL